VNGVIEPGALVLRHSGGPEEVWRRGILLRVDVHLGEELGEFAWEDDLRVSVCPLSEVKEIEA
jgi:hypothetical protein